MKVERELRKYEWHVTFSRKYKAYAVKYFLKNSKNKQYTTYVVGLYNTKEDAADAYNYMTADAHRLHRYNVDFMTTTWRKNSINYTNNTTHYHPLMHTGKTDFDKLAEIVDRHVFDDPPKQKLVEPEIREQIDDNLEKIVNYNKNLRFI